jgi:hypothetical protein
MDAGDHGMTIREDRPWLDVLRRKHECGPSLSPYRRLELTHEGKPLRVQIPDNLHRPERLEIRKVLFDDSTCVLIGFHSLEEGDPEECGVLMIGHRAEDGDYTVHVWHELYPWALKYLSLETKQSL